MKKKVLSMLVTCAMLLSMLPATAFAADFNVTDDGTVMVAEVNGVQYQTLDAAVNAAKDGDTVVILKGGNYSVPTRKNLTITGAVEDVKFDMSHAVGMSGASVTFNNVTFEYGSSNYVGLQHAGTMVYNDCTINGQVFLYGTSETFNDCTFNQSSADAYNVWTYGAQIVNFNNCKFNSAGKSVLVYNEGACATDLTVVNTKFIASAPVEGKAAIEIDTTLMPDGTDIVIDAATTATGFGKGSISGEELWNDKKDQTDLTVTVGEEQVWPIAVAQIGDQKFYSLQDAVNAAVENETVTITLLADVNTAESIQISDTLTIDLNGHTLAGTDTATLSFGLINIQPGADLTINDSSEDCSGAITLTATQDRDWNAYSSVISNQRGKLTVNGGTIEHLGGTDMAYGIDNLTNGTGTYAETIVNGGTVKSTYRAIRQFLNGTKAQNILTVNGGTIEGANKSIWMQDPSTNANSGTLTVSDEATLVGNVYLYVTSGSTEWPVSVSIANDAFADGYTVMTANVPEGTKVDVVGGYWGISDASTSYVAAIKGVSYTSLKDAINAAKPGDTVTLLDNVTADSTVDINKSITLDGGSYKISGTASPLLNLSSSADITVQNVTLEATKNVTRWNYVNEGYTHTYQNCQISGGVYGIHYDGSGGNVVINGCTIDGFNAFAGSLACVTIKDTTFDAKQSSYAGANLWGNTVIENVTLVDKGATTWLDVKTIAEVIGGKVIKDGAELSLESYLDAAAKIGTTYYNTLADAVAVEGVTKITLVSDVNETVNVGKPLTIQLNGNEIAETVTAADGFTVAKGLNKWIFGRDGDVILVTGVALDKTTASIYVGNTTTLVATVTPADATIDGITWSSNNESVATVDESGVVTGVAAGTATITATTENGGFAATCTVTVSRRPSGGGGGGSSSYTITVEDTKNGDITVSPSRASSGSTVTITVDPDKGYVLETLTVLDKNGKEVDLTKKADNKYTFKMPSGKVTVEASFAKTSSSPVDSFLDVNTGAWYYDAVKYAVENGLMSGTGTYTFEPNTTLSRGMIAQMLYALEGKPSVSSANNFTDVSSSDWYDKAASWAQSKGIITGYEDGRFGPNDPLTREQLALILYNYAKSEGHSTSTKADLSKFADDTSTSPWAQQAMSWAVGEGLLSGRGVNMLYPTGTATRAEVAQIMMNFCENVAK